MSVTPLQTSTIPQPGSPGWSAHLQKRLTERETLFWTKIAAMLAFGLPMCFLGPLAFASLGWVMFCTGRRAVAEDVAWISVFEWTAVVMLPILFLREWKAKRTLLEQAFLDGELGRTPPRYMPYGSRSTGNDALYVWLEIFLIGPRMVIRALRQRNERRSLRHMDRGQAAVILSSLVQARTGVEIESLNAPGLDRLMVRKIIIYLAFFEWIDLSSDLTRAWVETAALHSLGLDA